MFTPNKQVRFASQNLYHNYVPPPDSASSVSDHLLQSRTPQQPQSTYQSTAPSSYPGSSFATPVRNTNATLGGGLLAAINVTPVQSMNPNEKITAANSSIHTTTPIQQQQVVSTPFVAQSVGSSYLSNSTLQNTSINPTSGPTNSFNKSITSDNVPIRVERPVKVETEKEKREREAFNTYSLPTGIRPFAPEYAGKVRANVLALVVLIIALSYAGNQNLVSQKLLNSTTTRCIVFALGSLFVFNTLTSLWYLYGPPPPSSKNTITLPRDPRWLSSPSKPHSATITSTTNTNLSTPGTTQNSSPIKYGTPPIPLDYRLESPMPGGGMGIRVGREVLPLPPSPSPKKGNGTSGNTIGGVTPRKTVFGMSSIGTPVKGEEGSPLGNWRAKKGY